MAEVIETSTEEQAGLRKAYDDMIGALQKTPDAHAAGLRIGQLQPPLPAAQIR
jgi:hypothetical protein